jgi:hypothetical protein
MLLLRQPIQFAAVNDFNPRVVRGYTVGDGPSRGASSSEAR